MALPLIPTVGTESVTHRKRVAESINGILNFEFDSDRRRTPAEIAANIYPADASYLPGDVRRYGAKGDNATDDGDAIDQAISQSQQTGGSPWFIHASLRCVVSSSIVIAATCFGVIAGFVRGTGNFDIVSVTGDDVSIWLSGKIKGYGTFFQTGADNGSLIKNTGSNCEIDGGGILEDPPQYGILFRSSTATGGRLANLRVVGGPTTYVSPQHYAIEIEGLFRGGRIDNLFIGPNGTGRPCQGIASAVVLGTQPSQFVINNVHVRNPHDHGTYWYNAKSAVSNVTVSDAGGSGIRLIGPSNAYSNLVADNCTGGGIDLYNAAGCTLDGAAVLDFQAIGISIETHDSGSDDLMSSVTVTNVVTIGKANTSTVRCGMRIQTSHGGNAYSQANVKVSHMVIRRAGQSSTAEGAVQLQMGPGEIASRWDITDITIDECGWNGIELMGGGTFRDCRIDGNTVRQPGTNASASTTDTHGIRVAAGTTMEYGSVSRNICRDDAGSPSMEQGFSVGGTATLVAFNDNQSFGHTLAPGSFITDSDYTDGDTTPSIRNRKSMVIANSVATSITTLDDGMEADEVKLAFKDANTKLIPGTFKLQGGTTFNSSTSDVLEVLRVGAEWWETHRSVNA
jgi:hypothetical protein